MVTTAMLGVYYDAALYVVNLGICQQIAACGIIHQSKYAVCE